MATASAKEVKAVVKKIGDDDTDSDQCSNVAGSSADATVNDSAPSRQYSDIDLSYLELDTIPAHYCTIPAKAGAYHPSWVRSLSLHHNLFNYLPPSIAVFSKLTALDVSSNQMFDLPPTLNLLSELRVLVAKNNQLETYSFPKSFSQLTKLEILNLSGNRLEELPTGILDLPALKALYVGGNRIQTVPCRIGDMLSLEILYLGGNQLRDIPATIGKLKNLISLVLCDNQLETMPSTIANLQKLESLSLHNNTLKTLPTEIVTLKNLQQLSLRSNPLVARFARDMTFDPPTLKELAGRVVKLKHIPCENPTELPTSVIDYLNSAHQCVNPKCKGVYFEARVEHVKFVDFCGKYRIPLLQYLCSPKCSRAPAYAYTDSSSSDVDADSGSDDVELDSVPSSKLKKVLLG
jgi:hypothetical protein